MSPADCIALPIGDGPQGRRHPRETPAGASVEGETPAVVVPFAAHVQFAAESEEPVWGRDHGDPRCRRRGRRWPQGRARSV